ncbi:MAG: HEAT repeat domain-containing protein [Elusimicrobiota bacterium]|nr:MAG: HEAT repeat domain-containing protein [Elusimicrobiota bacterium]
MPSLAWLGLACALLALPALSIYARAQAPAHRAPGSEYPVGNARELVAALRSADPDAQKASRAALARADKAMIADLLTYGVGSRRDVGLKVVLRMGRPAIPAAFELLDDEKAGAAAGGVLFQLLTAQDRDRLPAIAACATANPRAGVSCAMTAFKIAAPGAAAHAGALGGCARAGADEARVYCTAALGRLGAGASAALSDLLAALKDANPGVRAEAAQALGAAGKGSPKAVAALKVAAADSSPVVAKRAKAALKRLTGA